MYSLSLRQTLKTLSPKFPQTPALNFSRLAEEDRICGLLESRDHVDSEAPVPPLCPSSVSLYPRTCPLGMGGWVGVLGPVLSLLNLIE